MTRFIHDKFAKDYLETLLGEFGTVKTPRRVSAEEQQIDVWFEPARENIGRLHQLGCLGKMAASGAIFEPFRNAVTVDEIGDCLLKWLLVKGEHRRQVRRKSLPFSLESVPQLWILTPTASATLLSEVNANPIPNELSGFYGLAPSWKTIITVIHQLPCTEETLWLRVLGRDKVQKQAIDELETLSLENPFRQPALELLYTLRENLQSRENLEPEEKELIMRLAPLYQKEKERLQREAKKSGMIFAQREIARKLLHKGMALEEIVELTELSLEEIAELANQE